MESIVPVASGFHRDMAWVKMVMGKYEYIFGPQIQNRNYAFAYIFTTATSGIGIKMKSTSLAA